jgi:hypothetical protein
MVGSLPAVMPRRVGDGVGYGCRIAELQITFWRELPSLVVARDATGEAKLPLAQRFQDAIDEAAMRLGAVSSDAYLEGWRRSDWATGEGPPSGLAASTVERLEQEWPPERIESYLAGLGPA